MKTQFKVLSVLAAALAVVFSTTGVSMAFSAPGEMANCRAIDSGLSFECDPVSNLVVVNSGVLPANGLGSPSFTTNLRALNDISSLMLATSLRGVNDFTPSATELILADFVANPSATELILADFVANPSVVATSLRALNDIAVLMPATSLRGVNDFTPSAAELILADFVVNPSATELILADFVANTSVVATSLRSVNSVDAALALQAKEIKLMPRPEDFYYGAR